MHILVADDHTLFRRGIELVLQKMFPDAALTGASDADEAMSALDRGGNIDLVLLDLAMPGMQGTGGVRRFVERARGCPVVILSAYSKTQDIMSCLAAGVRGYIPKSVNEDVLRHALELVRAGEIFVPSSVASGIGQRGSQPVPAQVSGLAADSPLRQLTPRQCDVLGLLIEGRSNKEIGRELGLLESTVKAHVKVIFRKLGAHNRTQAVLAAASHGWQMPSPDAG